MRTGRGRLARWLLAGLAVALATGSGDAQPFEYVITFDKVVVEGIEGIIDTPEVAHRELPGMENPPSSASGSPDRAKQSERPATQSPNITWSSPDSRLAFAPGRGNVNPWFVQEGFLVEAFWTLKTGTPEASFRLAHFHPPNLSSGFEAQHLGNHDQLHGLYIRSLDGKPFGLKRLRYRVTRNRQIPNKPTSIDGFSNFNVNVLVATSFDPRRPIRTQFVSFPVGLPIGNDLSLPWFSLRILGFERINHVYIASSASVDFDDIVLTKREPPSVPQRQQEEQKEEQK
jgi:hypothetical protein